MSVLIKGFNIPKDGCKDCAMVQRGKVFDTCPFLKREVNGNVERGGKPNGCPLVEVPDRKVGKWIDCVNSDHWKCNQCGCRAGFWFNEENSSGWEKDMSEWLSDFCPNCGAEMKGEDDDKR